MQFVADADDELHKCLDPLVGWEVAVGFIRRWLPVSMGDQREVWLRLVGDSAHLLSQVADVVTTWTVAEVCACVAMRAPTRCVDAVGCESRATPFPPPRHPIVLRCLSGQPAAACLLTSSLVMETTLRLWTGPPCGLPQTAPCGRGCAGGREGTSSGKRPGAWLKCSCAS